MALPGIKNSPPGYNFNNIEEIRSHSSVLYNERMAILFYMLDMNSINLNTTYDLSVLFKTRAILIQIYKNMRTLLRNSPHCRAILHLDTKDPGIYTTDLAFATIDKMVIYCNQNGYSYKRIHILIQELNNIELVIRDALQFFSYFIKPAFKQKPDIEQASIKYREMADERTVDELKEIIGKNHNVDFESLGSTQVDFTPEDDTEVYDKDGNEHSR